MCGDGGVGRRGRGGVRTPGRPETAPAGPTCMRLQHGPVPRSMAAARLAASPPSKVPWPAPQPWSPAPQPASHPSHPSQPAPRLQRAREAGVHAHHHVVQQRARQAVLAVGQPRLLGAQHPHLLALLRGGAGGAGEGREQGPVGGEPGGRAGPAGAEARATRRPTAGALSCFLPLLSLPLPLFLPLLLALAEPCPRVVAPAARTTQLWLHTPPCRRCQTPLFCRCCWKRPQP